MTRPAVLAGAREMLEELRAGRLTSEELVDRAIARYREVRALVNPLTMLDEQHARAAAAAADRERRAGRATGVLHGLPLTIKDCFEVAGMPSANGAVELRDYRPSRNAPAVQRLLDAGAFVLGRSCVPRLSLDLQTFSDLSGVTRNPWNPERSPGGSSGGAAAAVACGVTSLELGTDLAGSLRNPAHSTGVCALKPGFGVVPALGIVSLPPGLRRTHDLTVAGPIARRVDDLEMMLDVIAGPDPRDAAAWRVALPPTRGPARALRVGAWLDDPLCPVDGPVADALRTACAGLEREGVAIDRDARPRLDPDASFRDFFRLMYGEMSGGFPESLYRSFAVAARRPTDGDWTPLGAMPGDVTQSHRDWLAAVERREAYRTAWAEFFERYDVLVTPVAPVTAIAHDHRPFEERTIVLGGRERSYMQQAFWCALATVALLPAVAVPVGLAGDGMPVALQVIGPWLGERTALELARLVEKVTGGFRPPPV